MTFKKLFLAAGLAGAMLAAAPASAQERPAPPASAASPRQLELTRQYLQLMMSDQLKGALQAMIASETAGDRNTRDLPEEDRRFLIDLATELTHDMIPQMIEAIVPVYAGVFTEAELEALVAFYDTEMGRSIIDKSTSVMPGVNRAVMSVMPQLLDKMAARMCQHYGCEPGELEELRRGMRDGAGLASEGGRHR